MTDISPINRPAPPLAPTTGSAGRSAAPVNGAAAGKDQVDVSPVAIWVAKLHELPAVRQELVNRVKGQIQNGTYLTDEKVNGAVESMAEDLAG